ncbi:MAG: DNA polymerase IV [Nitrososphaerales archaeon]
MANSRPVILHLDIDSFYPSVETNADPSLKGKALIVGADPKKGRGVVVSCSYEARKLGIHAGQPISNAYKISPNAVYVRPNLDLYGLVSTRVMNLLRNYADNFEQVSIDEAFLDVSNKVRGNYEHASRLANEIKNELKETEGLSCSIGIAPNKSTAKIAADSQKPNGLVVVTPESVLDFLSPLKVSAITGVGKKTEAFLNSIGVMTIGDLQQLPGKDLVKYFGKTGVWLWGVAHGLEQIGVKERTLMKSLSQEHTFERDVQNGILVSKKLEDLAEKLHARLKKAGYEYRVVSVKIRFTHFQTFSRENSLPAYTQSKQALLEEAANLMNEFLKSGKKVRLVGVRVSDLRKVQASNRKLEQWF